MELKQIKKIIYQKDFDIMAALREHLLELEEKRNHMEALIQTVEQTIRSMKGEYDMSDQEKFQAFKERVVRENEEKHGAEIREKYGDEEMDAANRKVLDMTEEEYERFQNLGEEIRIQLQDAVRGGANPEDECGRRIVALHKEWLGKTWKQYTKEAHAAIGNLYISDERFKMYYDKEAHLNDEIWIFDWEGVPIRKIKINDKLICFCVDEIKGKIYCIMNAPDPSIGVILI